MTDRDDLELLAAWREGDEKAGNELFGRHFDAIYRFFRSKIQDNVDDLVQQTFLACVRNRDAGLGQISFRGYLYQAAKSKLYDALRTRVRRGVDVSMCSMADLRTSPSTWMARKQELQIVELALERLPLELQLAVELYYFDDRSATEVARILEIAEGTVRSRLRRALEAVRASVVELAATSEEARRTLDSLSELVAEKSEPSERPGEQS